MAIDSSGRLIPDNTLAAQLAATAVPPVKKPTPSFGPPTGAAAIALAPKPSVLAPPAAAADTTTPAAAPVAPPPVAPMPAAMTAPAPAAQSATGVLPGLTQPQQDYLGPSGPPINELLANYAVAQAAKSPQQLVIDKQNAAIRQAAMQAPSNPGGIGAGNNVSRPVGSIPLYG